MSEKIWRVDVSDEFLEFTEVEKPEDFDEVAIRRDYDHNPDGLDGTYCGNRRYDDKYFKLHRKLKASNFYSGYCGSITAFKDEWGNFSLRRWREAYGFGYAWEPQGYLDYKGKLYTKGCNFL